MMAVKECKFLDLYDAALVLRRDLRKTIGTGLSPIIFTDTNKFFEALMKLKRISKKRLKINIAVVSGAYNQLESSVVGLIAVGVISTELLTKDNCNETLKLSLHLSNEKVDKILIFGLKAFN